MAEHELNKIVDDSGEVFNLRDSTKQPVADRVTAWGSTPSDTKYPSEKLVKDSLDGKSNTNHTHSNLVPEGDNRNVATEPNDYNNKFIFKGIKNKTAIGSPSDDTFSYLFGLRGYANSTGGKAHELAFNGSGIFTRQGSTTTWDAWEKIITSKDFNSQARTIPQDVSKGANLVVNGSGRMSSNYNFSHYLYVPTIAKGGSAGSFGFNGTDECDEYISCDFNKKIVFSVDVKNLTTQPNNCTHRIFVHEYDIDKKTVAAINVMFGVGTLTELTQDLNPGDTVVHLADLSNANWLSTTNYHHGFIFWNYTNSYGYLYPPETYSRNVYPSSGESSSLWEVENVNVSAGTITLNNPWAGPAIPAGTKVSRRQSGNTYPYPASATISDTEWHTLKGSLQGITAPGTSERGSKFSQGTAFIRVGLHPTNLTNADETIGRRAVFANLAMYEEQDLADSNGVLPVNLGGTGRASVTSGYYLVGNGTSAFTEKTPNTAANELINALSTGASTPTGEDYYVAQYAGGGTTTKTYHRRPVKALWEYIKGQISSILGLTATSYGGNAATATKATQDSDGNAINATYFKSSGNTTLVSGAATKIGTQNGTDVKLTLPTIPSGTQLVYDCGTGSTSTTDFDNALAAYNAGKWVIINKDGVIYNCVGTYNSGLRFKQIANESDLLKVRALTWTRGSAPTVGTTLEAALTSQIPDISGKVNKSGDTMSGNLTISKGANQGDTKFVTSRTDTGTTGWFGIGDGGKNHGVFSETAHDNTNNEVDNDTKGWVVRTDENGYSTLTGAVDGLFSKYFGNTETLRGMKRFRFGYSLDLEGDYTHVGATAIIEVRIYSAGVSGGSITMLFNASAQGDARSYYRLQVLSSNNWNLNSVCPVLIVQQASATAKKMHLGLVSGGPTSTTLMTFNYTEVKVLPLNGARKFNWSFDWDTNDFNSNTMTMINPYVYPRAQIGTAVGDANTPVYVKNDGSFGTASGVDVAVALKDSGRGDVAGTSGHIVKIGYDNSSVPATTPSGTSTYAAGSTVGTTKNLVTSYRYDGVAFYKDVDSGNVTVGNSLKWNGYNLAIQNPGNTPAADTIYIF